jgi:hypothetical protein
MRIVPNLAWHFARNECPRPFRLELATQDFERRHQINLTVAGIAIERPRLALCKLGRNVARE